MRRGVSTSAHLAVVGIRARIVVLAWEFVLCLYTRSERVCGILWLWVTHVSFGFGKRVYLISWKIDPW